MANILHNVTGSTGVTTELLAPGAISGAAIKSILISNARDLLGSESNIRLFLQASGTGKDVETYSLLRNTVLPAGAAILLDEPAMVKFDTEFGLYITVGGSDVIDVIIKT
jgi:hypothetical protein